MEGGVGARGGREAGRLFPHAAFQKEGTAEKQGICLQQGKNGGRKQPPQKILSALKARRLLPASLSISPNE